MATSTGIFERYQHHDLRAFCFAFIIAGVITSLTSLVVLHLLPTGLSPIQDPVSQYGVTQYALGYRIQTVAMGIAGLAAAVGILALPFSNDLLVLFTFIFAASRLPISWFPMDRPGSSPTRTGRRHGILAIIMFTSALLAVDRVSSYSTNITGSTKLHNFCLGVQAIIWIGLIGMILTRRLKAQYFGVAERLFYLGMIGWLIEMAWIISAHL